MSEADEDTDLPEFFDDWDEVASRLGELLSNKDRITRVVNNAFDDYIEGEDVQPRLNEIFMEFPSLWYMAILDENSDLEDLLIQAEGDGVVGAEEKAEFEGFWDNIAWISRGAEAFSSYVPYDAKQLTEATLNEYYKDDNTMVLDHKLTWGVDTIFNETLFGEELLSDSVDRGVWIVERLIERVDDGKEIGEDIKTELDYNADRAEELVDLLRELQERTTEE